MGHHFFIVYAQPEVVPSVFHKQTYLDNCDGV